MTYNDLQRATMNYIDQCKSLTVKEKDKCISQFQGRPPPTLPRNTSGILIFAKKKKNIVKSPPVGKLDNQMIRFQGTEKMSNSPPPGHAICFRIYIIVNT